jgi:hypothetical protein
VGKSWREGPQHEERTFHRILEELKHMGKELDDLSGKVDAVVAGEARMHTLLDQVKAALDNALASGNPAQLQALSDRLGTLSADQEAAIAADTPVSIPQAQAIAVDRAALTDPTPLSVKSPAVQF